MRILTLTLAGLFALGLHTGAADAGPKGCPPGLAKKSPACVPPGQAKKGVTADEWLARGDYVGDKYERVYDRSKYRLPRLREGEVYYKDGTVVYRADRETRRVIEIIRLVDLISNG